MNVPKLLAYCMIFISYDNRTMIMSSCYCIFIDMVMFNTNFKQNSLEVSSRMIESSFCGEGSVDNSYSEYFIVF